MVMMMMMMMLVVVVAADAREIHCVDAVDKADVKPAAAKPEAHNCTPVRLKVVLHVLLIT